MGCDCAGNGGHSGGATPLPIPNREVKPACADGTRTATSRESRWPPINFKRGPRGPFLMVPFAWQTLLIEQFHFHPEQYLELMHSELPRYEELQQRTAEATREAEVRRAL